MPVCVFLLFIFTAGWFVRPVFATECALGIVTTATATLNDTTCVISTIQGIDYGTENLNSGILSIGGLTTNITINSTGKLIVGSASILANVLIFMDGGEIKTEPICLNGTDVDEDGYPSSTTVGTTCGIRYNSVAHPTSLDCNDANPALYQNLTGYTNSDGDSYGTGGAQQICSGASLPGGYAAVGGDCNDGDASVWQNLTCYTDADLDGRVVGGGGSVCSGASCPSGYQSSNGYAYEDCNDGSNQVFVPHATCYLNADIDGYSSTSTVANTQCLNSYECYGATRSSAASYGASVTTRVAGVLFNAAGTDCDDNNAAICVLNYYDICTFDGSGCI